jgi:hypothetical protein
MGGKHFFYRLYPSSSTAFGDSFLARALREAFAKTGDGVPEKPWGSVPHVHIFLGARLCSEAPSPNVTEILSSAPCAFAREYSVRQDGAFAPEVWVMASPSPRVDQVRTMDLVMDLEGTAKSKFNSADLPSRLHIEKGRICGFYAICSRFPLHRPNHFEYRA